MTNDVIYLDYNATTPIDPAVTWEMKPYVEAGPDSGTFGNPSSSHVYGQRTREAVERARSRMADLINADTEQVILTSGGSESNNTIIKGAAARFAEHGNHIITTRIEHPSVREPCRYLEEHDYGITYLPVDDNARLDPADVEDALRNDTILVSVMLANNEVGTIQPLEEIAEILRKEDVLLHTDAAQAIGKIPVDVNELGVDFLSIAGHKFYAPKGVGALYCRESDLFEPLVHGADHEQGLRAGTENVIFDVGLGKACEIADPGHEANRLESLRDDFHERLKDVFGDRLVLNGHPEHRLPNTLNVNFTGRDAGALLNQVEGVAASTGSACHSDRVELSPVLSAMGVDPEVGKGAVRFSLGRFTTEQDLEPAVEALRVADQALGK